MATNSAVSNYGGVDGNRKITTSNYINATSHGATITKWKSIATVWAEVKPLSGREYFSAQQVQSEITTQIWLRHLDGIKPSMRVKFGKRFLEIVAVLNTQERNVSLQLMCKEAVDG